ncbi:uncharacterized protein EI90DRAFT_275845 [Cantharellus anzutake]|uniref:uncharacterized protein n=1 Tax=Cantharellus anzutake TaxID=1750568 RepID=UPI0019043758|nr:uncharacterized protein EI90DRAFT_275845 [Cantharellus anzutake]KAF8335916.1 hypothetical protein EI90DRAFT_275845 [Cantharellus anzutake]
MWELCFGLREYGAVPRFVDCTILFRSLSIHTSSLLHYRPGAFTFPCRALPTFDRRFVLGGGPGSYVEQSGEGQPRVEDEQDVVIYIDAEGFAEKVAVFKEQCASDSGIDIVEFLWDAPARCLLRSLVLRLSPLLLTDPFTPSLCSFRFSSGWLLRG